MDHKTITNDTAFIVQWKQEINDYKIILKTHIHNATHHIFHHFPWNRFRSVSYSGKPLFSLKNLHCSVSAKLIWSINTSLSINDVLFFPLLIKYLNSIHWLTD